MERKIIFLDIDGVLQPCSSRERFKHIDTRYDRDVSVLPDFYKYLEKFEIDFSQYKDYDVAAVFFDWNKTALVLLRLMLRITGAKIVLSSDWRMGGFQRMKDFFTIHGLETYYIDNTKKYEEIDKNTVEKIRNRQKEIYGDAKVCHRSVEILEWLQRNQDVKNWVALDDMKLSGIDANFVYMEKYCFMENDAEKCFRVLTDNPK